MASFPPSRLSPFQSELLRAFFQQEQGFFLTGGAALVGFHLRHRFTDDLDFFTDQEAVFERAPHVLAAVVADLGASMVARQQATGFHRYFVSRGDEAVIVDLVLDRVPQIHAEKLKFDELRVDLPEEIIVNKLNTIVSRCEVRDLVDILMLERAGFSVEDFLEDALTKDGGCTAATLAWVLSQVEVGSQAKLPGGISGPEMDEYLGKLIRRLRRLALPES